MSQPLSGTRNILVIGHGPVAESIAMGLTGMGRQVSHVAPQPEALPFSLPLVCPIPELAALGVRPDLPMQSSVDILPTMPVALAKQGSTYHVTMADGSQRSADDIIIASTRWAAKLLPGLGLSLPLRPARAHQLVFKGQNILKAPMAENLGYGTVATWSTPEEATLIYDGLADPAQATFSMETDPRVITALHEWFRGQATTVDVPTPVAQGWSLGTTPDYYPVIGPWPGVAGLWLAAGVAGWGAALALPLASLFVSTFNGQPWPAALACVGPARFRDNQATPVMRPQWLLERHAAQAHPQFASQVRLVGGKSLSIMTEVQMVGPSRPELVATTVRTNEKVIQRPGMNNAAQRPEKGKVRMSSVGIK